MLFLSYIDVNSQVLVNLILLKWILKYRVGDVDLIHVVQGSWLLAGCYEESSEPSGSVKL